MKTGLLLSFIGSTLFATLGHGQIMTPSVEVTGDESILTTGTEVFGGSFNGTPTLNNGVTFQFLSNHATTTNLTSGVSVFDDNAAWGEGFYNSTFLDDGNNLTSAFEGAPGSTYLFFNVTGLTPGDTYTLQLFAGMTQGGNNFNLDDARSGSEGVVDYTTGQTTTLDWGQTDVGGNYVGSGLYSITDTFVAPVNGEEQYAVYGGSPGNGAVFYNGMEIREIPVPEPGTLAMLLAGGLVVAGLAAFRRLTMASVR